MLGPCTPDMDPDYKLMRDIRDHEVLVETSCAMIEIIQSCYITRCCNETHLATNLSGSPMIMREESTKPYFHTFYFSDGSIISFWTCNGWRHFASSGRMWDATREEYFEWGSQRHDTIINIDAREMLAYHFTNTDGYISYDIGEECDGLLCNCGADIRVIHRDNDMVLMCKKDHAGALRETEIKMNIQTESIVYLDNKEKYV